MHKIMRFIRQQRKMIIIAILVIIFIIAIISLLNYMARNNIKIADSTSNIYNTSNGTIKTDTSAVSGGQISETHLREVGNIIDKFVKFCNEQNVEKAYEIISNDCKEELYPNIDEFKNYYYEKVFNGKNRLYTIQNWIDDTYMVRFTDDLLASGEAISTSSYLDYITIVDENGQKKININKFIGKEKIEKYQEEDNIKIEVLTRKKYMDYEIYEIKAQNNTKGDILLDQLLMYNDKIYLKDNNDTRHMAFTNEIVKEDLHISQGASKKIKIKFDNPYITGRKIKTLCFSEIVLNYEKENKANIKTTRISVKL